MSDSRASQTSFFLMQFSEAAGMPYSIRVGPPRRLLWFTLLAIAVGSLAAPADAKRRRGVQIEDDELPLVFKEGGIPGTLDGQTVRVIGAHPEFIRVFYNGETLDLRNDQFQTLAISGVLWRYRPGNDTYEAMVADVADEPFFVEKLGAVGNDDQTREILRNGKGYAKEPEPEPESDAVIAKAPPPSAPPPSAPPSALPKPVDPPAAVEADGAEPFNVPDWVKYLAAAAAIFVVINFFRN